MTALVPSPSGGHPGGVAEEMWPLIGMVLTGLGIVVGGSAGLLLPRGRRAGAVWSLMIGAGVGFIVLALGTGVRGYEESLVHVLPRRTARVPHCWRRRLVREHIAAMGRLTL